MFEEELKSDLTELINRWTCPNFETPEIRPLLSKSEFLEVLKNVIKVTFAVNVDFFPTANHQNDCSHTLEKITDSNCNVDPSERYQSLDPLPLTDCEYLSEEVCRDGENVNMTICIEDETIHETNKQLDSVDTSPIVFINDIGRSDTFEVCSPNRPEILVDGRDKEISNEHFLNRNKIDELSEKLDEAFETISDIAKSAFVLAKDIDGIKKELQKETNKLLVSKRRNSLSPAVTTTPIISKTNIPSFKLPSMRKKSSSFTNFEDEAKLKTPSPNRSASTSFLSSKKKSLVPYSKALDPREYKVGTKTTNLKYSHVQSTIPKASPIGKRTPKK